jgi:hypothetical protein
MKLRLYTDKNKGREKYCGKKIKFTKKYDTTRNFGFTYNFSYSETINQDGGDQATTQSFHHLPASHFGALAL